MKSSWFFRMELKNSTRAWSSDFPDVFHCQVSNAYFVCFLAFHCQVSNAYVVRDTVNHVRLYFWTFDSFSSTHWKPICLRLKTCACKKVKRTAPTAQPPNWRNKRMREAVHVQEVGTCPAYKLSACQSVHLSVCQSHRLPVWWSITGEWLRH